MSDESAPRQLVPAELEGELPEFTQPEPPRSGGSSNELDAVFDVPVTVQAVLGRSTMDVGELMKLKSGHIIELDRRVGEPVDIYVNNRLIARGEVVLIDNVLGVTLTEIVRQDR